MLELGMPTLIELPELADCAQLCRELGLQFVELNMNLPQYQADRFEPAMFRQIQEEYGIYFTIHLDENLNPADFNPHVSEAYQRTTEEAILFAKALKIPILNMHLSRGVYFTMPDRKIFLYDVYREAYLGKMCAFRERCERVVGASDVRICIENSDGFTDFHEEALQILLKSPVFALTYDIGHNHAICGRDEPIILQHSQKLAHFHFHDAKDKRNHLPLGTGDLDLPKYLRLAEQCGSRIVLETKTIEGLRQSVCWMERTQPSA